MQLHIAFYNSIKKSNLTDWFIYVYYEARKRQSESCERSSSRPVIPITT